MPLYSAHDTSATGKGGWSRSNYEPATSPTATPAALAAEAANIWASPVKPIVAAASAVVSKHQEFAKPSTKIQSIPAQHDTNASSLIVSWSIAGKNVLVVGGDALAASRAAFAVEAHAQVTVVAPNAHVSSAMKSLITEHNIKAHDRFFTSADLNGKSMVFVCLDSDPSTAREIGLQCRSKSIPVNVSSSSELSDFFFMSTFRDKSLQVAISTNGNGPRLANKLRRQIALSLPSGASSALENLAKLRQLLKQVESGHSSSARKLAYLNKISDTWSIDALANLTESDLHELAHAFAQGHHETLPKVVKGTLRVVYVTTPEVDDLTHGAVKALLDASLVLADSTVSQEILDTVGGDLLLFPTSQKKAARKSKAAEAAVASAIRTLEAGQDVVRLKSLHESITSDDLELEEYARSGFEPVILHSVGSHKGQSTVVHHQRAEFDEEHISREFHHRSVPAVISKPIHVFPTFAKETTFAEGDEVVSTVAYALSDMSFVYGPTPDSKLGHRLTHWSKQGKHNAHGKRHTSQAVETTMGAGAIVHGAAFSGKAVTSVAGSSALPSMIPALCQIASNKLPVVIHVAAQSINRSDLTVSTSFADVLAAGFTGFGILGSDSVKESHDLALIAHVAAKASKSPFIHFFDGVRTAVEQSNVSVFAEKEIGKFFDHAVFESSALAHAAVPDLVQHVMDKTAHALGHHYQIFEYVGHSSAETVLVTLGPASTIAEEAVLQLVREHHRVGVLKVRLVRPWSSRHFLSALPRTVKRVAVVDQTRTDGAVGHGPLYLDVTAAFYDASWGLPIPSLSYGTFESGATNFHPAAIRLFLQREATHGNVKFSLHRPAGAVSDDFKGHQAIFWDVDSDKTHHAASHIVSRLEGNHSQLQAYTAHSALRVEPIRSTHLRFGDEHGPLSQALIDNAGYVGVHSVAILKEFNVVASLKHGGILLINRPGSSAASFKSGALAQDIGKEIPAAVVAEIHRRAIRVAVVDAYKLAADLTLFRGNTKEYENLILESAFYFLTATGFESWPATLEKRIVDAGETCNTILRTKLIAAASVKENVFRVTLPHVSPDNVSLHTVIAPTIAISSAKKRSLEEDDTEVVGKTSKAYHAAMPVVFKEAFGVHGALRPDVEEDTYTLTVTENRRLTPVEYERNVFHIEFDLKGTGMKYEIGDALGVYGENDKHEVYEFIKFYGLNPHQIVAYERNVHGKAVTEFRTIEQLLIQVVDLFGKPGKKFYQFLVPHAADWAERERIGWLASGDGAEDLESLTNDETPSFADVLRTFPSARPSFEELLAAIPVIKPRHYSISSAMSLHKHSVHLLVVVVDWKTKSGVKKYGQCTRYLVDLRPGQTVTVSVKPSVMKLPHLHTAPVIMAGLGTGMAPFRAFIEERAVQKAAGKKVGPMALYFGSRHRSEEYLYGEEMEAYHADGLLTYLRPAFSRDQKEKVYIQHKIGQDGEKLAQMLLKEHGSFYLCGPTWPVPDVKDALVKAFLPTLGSAEKAEEMLEEMKEEERYVLEVY